MPDVIAINGREFGLGECGSVDLLIGKLPTHTAIEIPVYVFRGPKDGPVLLLSAGLHGDEVNGVEIVRRMIDEKRLQPTRGSIIAVPIMNVFGFIHFSRELPDGKDINRSFPGSKDGSLARRNAYLIMKEILPSVDYGVDFHTGGASRSNYPQIRCVIGESNNMELAEAFAAPFIVNSRLIDKSFRQAAHRAGKQIIVYEAGESLRFDEFAIQEGINGALRLLRKLKMISRAPRAKKSIILAKSRWLRASSAGLFVPYVESGKSVERGQVLGRITDPFGEKTIPVKCPEPGHIIAHNNIPVVNRGDALFHLGIQK